MKYLMLTLTVALLMVSCQNNGNQKKDDPASSSEQAIDTETPQTDLSEKTPYTETEFQEAYPKSINGWTLDEAIKVVKQQAIGEYGDGKLRLNMHDMAGKHSGYSASTFLTTYNIKVQDNETTHHIHKERDGIKTVSTYDTGKNKSMISFIYHARWLVVLNSNDMNPDELWKTFDRNTLKNFK
jgi:hypothetical protein